MVSARRSRNPTTFQNSVASSSARSLPKKNNGRPHKADSIRQRLSGGGRESKAGAIAATAHGLTVVVWFRLRLPAFAISFRLPQITRCPTREAMGGATRCPTFVSAYRLFNFESRYSPYSDKRRAVLRPRQMSRRCFRPPLLRPALPPSSRARSFLYNAPALAARRSSRSRRRA